MDDDHLEQIARYTRKIYSWVVIIGTIVILGVVVSFCGALLSTST